MHIGSRLFLATTIGLFALWIALSGHFSPLFLALGVFSAIAASLAGVRMRRAARLEGVFRPGLRFIFYVFWLGGEIVRSNFAVARIVLSPSLPISPQMTRIRARQTTDLGRMILANSITLTPATVTVETGLPGSDKEAARTFLVHALTREAASGHGLEEMNRRIADLEGDRA